MKTVYNLTSNQYHGGLNRRFDNRAKLLKRMGYKYTRTQYGAMFVRQNIFTISTICAQVVQIASKFDFYKILANPITLKTDEQEKRDNEAIEAGKLIRQRNRVFQNAMGG